MNMTSGAGGVCGSSSYQVRTAQPWIYAYMHKKVLRQIH